MQTRTDKSTKPALDSAGDLWLRKHAEYQRVYREGQRRSLPLMTYFFAPRCATVDQNTNTHSSKFQKYEIDQFGPRVGLTAGRVVGNAVERNRIKRRMREAVRRHCAELTASVDIVLHPRKAVLDAPFADIERDVLNAFRTALRAIARG